MHVFGQWEEAGVREDFVVISCFILIYCSDEQYLYALYNA